MLRGKEWSDEGQPDYNRIDALWHYATIDRVSNVMRPYLESVTT